MRTGCFTRHCSCSTEPGSDTAKTVNLTLVARHRAVPLDQVDHEMLAGTDEVRCAMAARRRQWA
jgi:hypothetical protein